MGSNRDITGKWYGMVVHYPNLDEIQVSIAGENGTLRGSWEFPQNPEGNGVFSAKRFADFLNVRIRSKPLESVQCQIAILEDHGGSMLTGIIPLEGREVPFATVTLFREQPKQTEIGICPQETVKKP